MTNADIDRLYGLLQRWDDAERVNQQHFGDAIPRSVRAMRCKDADALRAVLAGLTRNNLKEPA